MLNLVFQMGKSEMERKGNFGPSYLSFPVPFRPFQINPAFLSLSEKNGQLSGKGNIAFLSLTCMGFEKIRPNKHRAVLIWQDRVHKSLLYKAQLQPVPDET